MAPWWGPCASLVVAMTPGQVLRLMGDNQGQFVVTHPHP